MAAGTAYTTPTHQNKRMADAPSPSKPTPDQAAAHEFLTELRTRISTQPLPYQYGVEARALESLWELFGFARAAMKAHPGCQAFAALVTRTLNLHVRPVTAKWHRAHTEGRLSSRDGADAFRGELATLQIRLRRLASDLHEMAYGVPAEDPQTPPAVSAADLATILGDVPFGISGSGPLVPDNAAEINADEAAAVHARRTLRLIATPTGTNAVGLALSGGGIRSAAFCLGVVQVLAKRGLYKDVDFLSTVSGGGYTGSFLTTRLGDGEPIDSVAGPYGPDPDAIRYLRQHAKYLAAVDVKQRWSMLTSTLAGMLLNWSAPLLLVVVAALVAIGYGTYLPPIPWPTVARDAGAVDAVCLVIYGVGLRKSRESVRATGWLLSWALALTAAVFLGWILDAGYHLVVRRWPTAIPTAWWRASTLAALVSSAPAALRLMPWVKKPSIRALLLKLALCLCAVILPITAVAVLYALTFAGMKPDSIAWEILLASALFLALIAFGVLNINATGLHRMYRDQLARTFTQPDEIRDAPLALSAVNPRNSAPHHLINATLNVPSSTSVALRERRSDFFLFSRSWCGSPSTGYRRTARWSANGRTVDLPTAMAVSGAAISPNMGLGSKPALRALMTFLNVRLGFWIRREGKGWLHVPGFLCLLREMTGVDMSETDPWLNLSDGGHIENLGVYELLRRRCKYIICVDGEQDPERSFHGLMTLVRHAQIDFGTRIVMGLDDLRPGERGYSQTHAVLCRVHYSGDQQGLMLYLKLSLTGNEPELIRRYRLLHPDFPHQSTADQFFDEEQFEAYRQLGVHVADGLFTSALVGGADPPDVPFWFRRLAASLIDPSQA